MKRILIFMIMSSPSLALAAPSSLDAFLSSAWSDHKVTLQQKNAAEFGSSSGFKPLEGMQVQISQNEVIEDQKIALRLLPRGYTQDRLLGRLSAGQNRIEALNSQKAVTQALAERYNAAIDYINAYELEKLWSSISKLREKRLSMLQVAARSSQARATDLIKQRAEAEQSDVKAVLAKSELKMATVKMKALDPRFSEIEVKTSDLPTPMDMLKIVTDLKITDSSFGSQLAREHAVRAHETLEYEIAKDDRFLEYVEFSYAEQKVDKNKEFGVKLSFNIPGFASTELNRSEKARELVKYEIEAREAQRKESILQAEAKEALSLAADLYQSLSSINDRPSEKRMRKLVSQQDPLLSVTLDEEGLQRQIRLQELSAKAFSSYLGFLASSGTLAVRSTTNFLSKSLREIRP